MLFVEDSANDEAVDWLISNKATTWTFMMVGFYIHRFTVFGSLIIGFITPVISKLVLMGGCDGHHSPAR